MKKILLACVVLAIVSSVPACPFCGCGVGGFYVGLLPNFKNKFIGVRYEYMSYETHLTSDATQYSYDHYQIAELWGGFNIGKKWQVLALIPYHINQQNTDDGLKKQNGTGDATLLADYKLWQKTKIDFDKRKSFSQEVWIGGGVKLPTGKYSVDLSNPDTELGDVNSQMGTGSLDFIMNAVYKVTINKFGINANANYKINTSNTSNFKYGNRFTANSFGFYQTHIKAVNIAPNIGLMYEDASLNYLAKKQVEETGGYVALAAAGVEMNIKKITVGTNVQLPFSQNFAEGQTVAKTRGMLHVTFTF